jgi:DNA (cytosine-5)-methyltransferase 1
MPHPSIPLIEICAGAGGQALGLEKAGFAHQAAIEIDDAACASLRTNRPHWAVIGPPTDSGDVREWHANDYRGIGLLAGGVPCPPFSIAGKQLGENDERDLFPSALRLVEEALPRVVLLENVPGLATARFQEYRADIQHKLNSLGYHWIEWQSLNARDYGVSQLRPRFVLVAFSRKADWVAFEWPRKLVPPPTVGAALFDLMAASDWPGAFAWREKANAIAPTIVGGSKKHGGADLGPTRAKQAWRLLGVDGMGIANTPPGPDFPTFGLPKLTLQMVARLQGFPDDWHFAGKKTSIYRQIGNAFPPPFAAAVGRSIASSLHRNSVSAAKAGAAN